MNNNIMMNTEANRIGNSVPPKPAPRPDLRVAPMMDWTDRHCRYFHRLLSPHISMTSEMIHTGAILFGDKRRALDFDPSEHPLALQLGGSDPDALARAARIGADWGYNEINLNCGCPSERVQSGAFGACLMQTPAQVAACVAAMRDAVQDRVPITVKCRIGVDDSDEDQFLSDFVGTVAEQGGCGLFIIHARKAWLKGLSPKENREIPPLNYPRVYRLKNEFPHLKILINGGFTTTDMIADALAQCDGVMIGRAAYQNPVLLHEIEARFYNPQATLDREGVMEQMEEYAARIGRENGTPRKSVMRHVLGLYNGEKGARAWRRAMTETAS